MATAATEIRQAKAMLEKAGIRKAITPPTLVAASREMKKPLRDTLDYLRQMFAEAEGMT